MKKMFFLLLVAVSVLSCIGICGCDPIINSTPPFHKEPMKVVIRERPCFGEDDERDMFFTYVLQQTSPNGKVVWEYFISDATQEPNVPKLWMIEPLTVKDITLYPGDSVFVSGWATDIIKEYGTDKEYRVIEVSRWPEVEQLEVFKRPYLQWEEATIEGVLAMVINPCITMPCTPGMDWAIITEDGTEYVLPNIGGFEEGDSVRAKGSICTDIDTNMAEYKRMRIDEIIKL